MILIITDHRRENQIIRGRLKWLPGLGDVGREFLPSKGFSDFFVC